MLSKLLRLGALAIGGWSVISPTATAQKADVLGDLATRVHRLERQIRNVESVRAIKRLQYAYGHYTELGLWNDFADLFTDDAITNYQQGARGKAQVRKLFFDQVGQGKLGLADGRIYPHILFQPVIHLTPDGEHAKGRWRILAMLGGYGGSATWYSGVYENEYVLENGVWKISVLRSEPKATAAYTAAGWKDSGVHIPYHYLDDAASVTRPIAESTLADTNPVTGASLTSLADRLNELEQRAARLNDQAEVTNLQDTYGYAVDRKLWDQAANLFTGDGTLELGLQGVYAGKASIRRAFDQFGKQGLGDHVYLQTVVSVAPDGRTAKARGVEILFSSSPGGAELSEGVFENRFVKQEGAKPGNGWKIQSVHFYPRMIVDAATGWAKSAKPAPGPSKEFPPDGPPTSSYGIYPKFSVAPFHFDNPVTGKPPQYPEGVLASNTASSGMAAGSTKSARAVRDLLNGKDLAARVAEVEQSATAAEAYDAAENLIGAYGYYSDKSPAATVPAADELSKPMSSLFARDARKPEDAAGQPLRVNQMLQPVIQISPDGKTVKLRARVLELGGGTSGSAGTWAAGALEGEAVRQDGTWKFRTLDVERRWSAPYPGGWGAVRSNDHK